MFINPEKTLWCRINVRTDPFDSLTIRSWGALGTGHGGDLTAVFSSMEEAVGVVAAETQRRLSRGYQLLLRP